MNYSLCEIELRQTTEYERWFKKLRNLQAKARINARLRRLTLGNFGDVKPVGEGILELRIDCGPGYRVYFSRQGRTVIVLLAGGDKSTQVRDLKSAKQIAQVFRENHD